MTYESRCSQFSAATPSCHKEDLSGGGLRFESQTLVALHLEYARADVVVGTWRLVPLIRALNPRSIPCQAAELRHERTSVSVLG